MPKKDSTTDPVTDIQNALNTGRKRALNFALLKSKDGVVLKTHPVKSPDVMLREAKAAGGMPAVSCAGTLTVTGKVMTLAAGNEDVPRNLPKLARKYFQSIGVPCKVRIVLPGGAELGDEEEGTTEGQKVADTEVEDGADINPIDVATVTDRLDALQQRSAQITGLTNAVIERGIEQARALLGEENIDAAGALIDQLDEQIASLEADFAQLNTQLQDGFSEVAERLQWLVSEGAPSAAKKATQLGAMFQAEMARDLKKAGAVLSLTVKFVDAELAKLETSDRNSPKPGPKIETPAGETGEDGPPTKSFAEMPKSIGAALGAVAQRLGTLWDGIFGEDTPPAAASDPSLEAEQARIKAQRAALQAFYDDGEPDANQAAEIAEAQAKLESLIRTASAIKAATEDSPEAAAAMREAMAGFDAELGTGTDVTPEFLAQIETERADAKLAQTTAESALAAAHGLPQGRARNKAVELAQQELNVATGALDTADRRLTAAQGKQGLTTAIISGPLSPEAPLKLTLEDSEVAAFVEAYRRHPALADFGLETAATSDNPGAISAGMEVLCDRMEGGFAAHDGSVPPSGFDADAYARNLIKGAGAEGGEYMAAAASYIDSGGHFTANPIPSPSGNSAVQRERDRSNYIAGAVIGPDGSIDPDSAEARAALDHLRFSPDVLDSPTPSLNKHVTATYAMLSNEANRERAQNILGEVDTPTGSGQLLLSRALGTPNGSVTQDQAREQVVAALMTPVHQGAVGSCFATAGVRRMSELNPLESMQRYAELAEDGIFRPRNGEDPIPAIMTFPAEDNPLIRSMEYSAATVMAGMDGNRRHTTVQNGLNSATDGLSDATTTVDRALIRATLHSSFTVIYDAQRRGARAADGSSSLGVYTLTQTQPVNRPINTQAEYVAALTERVLTAIGEPADSDRGREVVALINSADYLATLGTPWELGSGGFPDEADEVLFGEAQQRRDLTSSRGFWDDLFWRDEGDRTEDLLETLLAETAGAPEDMVPVMNLGIHAFNLLPNDPSMVALREGGDIAGNIERMLVEPGQKISSTALSENRATEITREFYEGVKRWDPSASRQPLVDRALRGGPGVSGLTPARLQVHLIASLSDYLDQCALDSANQWFQTEVRAGRVRTEADRDARRDSQRTKFVRTLEGMILTATMGEISIPSVTVANANWGNAEYDVDFVMAPNPMTGELIMWKKYRPSGDMRPAGKKWTDAGWQIVEDVEGE